MLTQFRLPIIYISKLGYTPHLPVAGYWCGLPSLNWLRMQGCVSFAAVEIWSASIEPILTEQFMCKEAKIVVDLVWLLLP